MGRAHRSEVSSHWSDYVLACQDRGDGGAQVTCLPLEPGWSWQNGDVDSRVMCTQATEPRQAAWQAPEGV